MYNLSKLKRDTNFILDGLENTLCGAANEIKNMDIPYSDNFAEMVMGEKNYVEVEIEKYGKNAKKNKDYEKKRYENWEKDMKKINSVIKRYMGDESFLSFGKSSGWVPLDYYLDKIVDENNPGDTIKDKVEMGVYIPQIDKLKNIAKAFGKE